MSELHDAMVGERGGNVREILFKAKRIDNGEWVEGNLLKIQKDYYICEKPYKCVKYYSSLYGEEYGIGSFKLINKDTLCQFTGLTDKNSNKIWENDILKYSYDYPDSPWLKAKGLSNDDIKYSIGQVFWSDWRGSWSVCSKGTSRMANNDVFTYSRNPNRTEVMGNIFDNPESLEIKE